MQQTRPPARARSILLVAALAALINRPAAAEEIPQRRAGLVWSNDLGYRVPLAGDIRLHLEEGFIAGMGIGVQDVNLEVSLIGRLSEESQTIGFEGLVRMPFFTKLFVGAGIHFGLYGQEQAVEIVLPRFDLRFRVSRSWEVSWTVLRLAYVHKNLSEDEKQYMDEQRGLMAATSVGVRGRVNQLWERDPPAPLSPGVLIRANHMLGLVGLVADEWSDPEVSDDWEDASDGFPYNEFVALELSVGYRLTFDSVHMEISVPVGIYNNLTVGLGVMWRLKALPFLAVGLQASYFPDRYILVEIPRVTMTYRPSDAVEIFLNPIGVIFLIEPSRDVWVEEGFESKVPYWGLVFGTGIGWTIPTASVRGRS